MNGTLPYIQEYAGCMQMQATAAIPCAPVGHQHTDAPFQPVFFVMFTLQSS
jgi:hypothetical protein